MINSPLSRIIVNHLIALSGIVSYSVRASPQICLPRASQPFFSAFSTMSSSTMRAVVIREPGPPSVLKIEDIPIPTPSPSQVLIRAKAFGLNRSELFTRRGDSGPAVPFPRVLGIEAVGIVHSDPSGKFQPGDAVATCMGGMGRLWDGGYAEYTCPPSSQVVKIKQPEEYGLTWADVGMAPEMMQTAYGALTKSLQIDGSKRERLLIRGGTTSVGLAAAFVAKSLWPDVYVASTTRSDNTATHEMMKSTGAHEVIVDDGNIAAKVQDQPYDKVLELVGVVTMSDSLRCVRRGGIVCITGIVGDKWTIDGFNPFDHIPKTVLLTSYGGGPQDFQETPLDMLLEKMKESGFRPGKVFKLDEIVEAHTVMEENKAGGKVVVVVD